MSWLKVQCAKIDYTVTLSLLPLECMHPCCVMRVALAHMVTYGKEQLVLIRPYQNGLVLHAM